MDNFHHFAEADFLIRNLFKIIMIMAAKIVSGFAMIGWWTVRRVNRIESEMITGDSKIKQELHSEYAKKDDVRHGFDEIKLYIRDTREDLKDFIKEVAKR
jgi:hypothetical protein